MAESCDACSRSPGLVDVDRHGQPEPAWRADVELGPLARCTTCLRLACPECLHERECCELDCAEDGTDLRRMIPDGVCP